MQTKTIRVKEINDRQNVQRIQDTLYDVWGVNQVEVSGNTGVIQLTFDQNAASVADFEQALIDQGFQLEGGQGHAKDL